MRPRSPGVSSMDNDRESRGNPGVSVRRRSGPPARPQNRPRARRRRRDRRRVGRRQNGARGSLPAAPGRARARPLVARARRARSARGAQRALARDSRRRLLRLPGEAARRRRQPARRPPLHREGHRRRARRAVRARGRAGGGVSPLTGRRRALGALALAAFLLVFALGLLIDSPDEPAVVLYAIPVALLALAFGTWAGMLGGVLGAALFWAAGGYHDASYSAADVGYRLIVLVALGALIGWLATRLGDAELAADVAERRRAENELRRSEASLAEAQRIAHLGSWEWDVQDDLVTWSDALHRICGLEPGSLDLSYEAFLEDRKSTRLN